MAFSSEKSTATEVSATVFWSGSWAELQTELHERLGGLLIGGTGLAGYSSNGGDPVA